MIPRVWQCERPEWWEHLLGVPFSSYAVLVLLAAYVYLYAGQWHRLASIVRRVGLILMAVNGAIVASGLFVGLVVRLLGGSPNTVYEGARAIWLGSGWITVGGALAWSIKQPPPPRPSDNPFPTLKRLKLALLAVVVMLMAPAIGFLRYTDSPTVQTTRAILEFFPDAFTTVLQTDECLYEHKLEYLAPGGSAYGPPGGLAATKAGDELGSRLRSRNISTDIEPANRAFRSYRQKVLRGELQEPKSFDGLKFRDHPRQLAELRAWAADTNHSDESRALARMVLERTQHPPPEQPAILFGVRQTPN
jgi:hypothetical protein